MSTLNTKIVGAEKQHSSTVAVLNNDCVMKGQGQYMERLFTQKHLIILRHLLPINAITLYSEHYGSLPYVFG